jgi:acyl-CoA synthetase (AMP-forming)/AMP-acid ligase II
MIIRSPYPDIEISDSALTPFVLRHAERLAAKPALIDGVSGRTMTYQELARAIRGTAAGLAARGFRAGDVFAIYAANCIEYAVAFHAVSWLGGVMTTVNPAYTADELEHQLKDSGASRLLTTPDLMAKAGPAARGAGITEIYSTGKADGTIPFADVSESVGDPPVAIVDAANDTVALLYSSGTTGLPKGVMLTHQNLVANIEQLATVHPYGEDDVALCLLPIFHSFGLQVLLNHGLAVGATLVLLPRFEIESFLTAIERYGVTYTALVPPVVLILSTHEAVDRYDVTQLRRINCGAAPLSAGTSRACASRLGCAVEQGYGLTETSPVAHMTSPGRNIEGSVGPLVPNTEAKIVDLVSGESLGPNSPGELWVRGPQITKGYLNRPDATATTIDEDGWLHTGDIACVDEAGSFAIVDRLKELIKYKGYQVAPAELEAVLLTHPAVADAAVIPSPDLETGEVPKAFVVLRSPASAEELMAFVADRVAPHKKVRRVEFIDCIPKSPTGKILRRVLVEQERVALAVAG